MVDTPYIIASGLPTYEEVKQKTVFPSGVFNIPIDAYLSAFNATLGFNATPSRFDLEYIPNSFSYTALPSIGSGISMYIGDFYIHGRIKHADWSKSDRGNILSIGIEDIREDLKDFYIDTYGVFGGSDSPAINIIDIRYWYIKNYADTRTYARSRIIRDLDMIEQQGASYRQIYEAIKYFEEQVGTVYNLLSKIPTPEVIEAQLPEEPDAYRWKFRSEPLIQVINKICEDVSYEWYWDMRNQRVNVINRKYAVNIGKNDIPIPNDPNQLRSLRYGNDEGERPTAVRLYGAEMEGIIGSGIFCTQSGAYGLNENDYDLGIQVGSLRFVPGWRAKLKYFSSDGWLHTYTPGDRELAMALKGLEFWCMEKGLDNRISNQTINARTGRTLRQESITGSGMGRISNRRHSDRMWVMEWYNRVRTFAQNHYGRTYVLSKQSVLYNYLDEIDVVSAAWCNIENLTDDGSFADNYKISAKYKWLALFWEAEANKMKAFATVPATTKWGIDGEGTPGTDYNQSNSKYFFPIEAKKWDITNKKFDEEFLETLGDEKGILIRLPNIAWKDFHVEDSNLQQHHTLISFRRLFESTTTLDVQNPFRLSRPFSEITDVALPIRVRRRYGYSYPTVWSSGTGLANEVQINEQFAPWNYEPRGTKTSVQLMNDEAQALLFGRIVNRNIVTFAEAVRLNLPTISFDNFANQSLATQGYGIISHGVTSINVTKNIDWWQTKYSIKSHFPEFVRAKPVYKGLGEDFNFMLKRMKDDIIRLPKIDDYVAPNFFDPKSDDGRETIKADTGIEQKLERWVTISAVYNRGQNEYYLGIDDQNIAWPRALDAAFGDSGLQQAHCTDGYLQVGMSAVYHLEITPHGDVLHYFTGGIPLTAGRIVELITSPALVQAIWTASSRTLATVVQNPRTGANQVVEPFYFYNTPFAQQASVDTSLAAGDKLMLSGDGNKKMLIPDADYGPGSQYYNQAFLVNAGTPSTVNFGYVTVKPNSSGRGASISTFSPTGGVAYADGQLVGGKRYWIYFVGAEIDQVQANDPCIISEMREQSGDYRLYCFVVRPVFAPPGAFGV